MTTVPSAVMPFGGAAPIVSVEVRRAYRFLGGISAMVLLVTGVGLFNAATLVNRPFPGFLVNQNLKVGMTGQYHWTGTQVGLRYPDRILEADGQPLRSPKDLQALVRSRPAGTPLTYVVGRQGERFTVTVVTMSYEWLDFAMTAGLLALTALVYLGIGVVVFVLKPLEPQAWTFLAASCLLSVYTATTFDLVSSYQLLRVNFAAHALVPAVFVHFSFYFPRPVPAVLSRRWLVLLPYAAAVALLIPVQLLTPLDAAILFQRFTNGYLIAAVFAVLYPIARAYVRPLSVIARQRAKVVLAGAAIAFPIPASAYVSQWAFGSFFGLHIKPNLLTVPMLLFPASIGYAIARHNLFDVDVYIKRTVGYVLMTIVVGAGYVTAELLMKHLVLGPLLGEQADAVFPFVFALLVVFFFHPINERIQALVERAFFRKAFDYKVVIQRVNTALNSARALDEIMTRLTTILRREIFLDTAGVVIKDPHKNHCQALLISDGPKNHLDQVKELCVTLDDPLLALLSRERRLITKYDVAEDPRFGEVREACGRRFAELGASVAIPLIHQEQVTGLLAVGYKKSGHFYTREDIDLLTSVADQGAVAIEQVRETAQRATLMQLFSKHVSPEVAESLWQQRDQFLDGGRPRPQKLLATILFTDLQGFSSVSEKQEPQVLMDWLNTYMEALATKVMEHHGVVDNYIGDAVKADFGVPLPRTTEAELREDATNAVACALAMEREVIRLNAVMESRGLPTLRMRVGINTGPVVAGSLGSSDRLKYTTLGDAVNTASRLESYDKALVIPELDDRPCRILVSRATLMFLGDAFDTRQVGELALKGKEQMIDVYCVLGRAVGTPAIPALTESV